MAELLDILAEEFLLPAETAMLAQATSTQVVSANTRTKVTLGDKTVGEPIYSQSKWDDGQYQLTIPAGYDWADIEVYGCLTATAAAAVELAVRFSSVINYASGIIPVGAWDGSARYCGPVSPGDIFHFSVNSTAGFTLSNDAGFAASFRVRLSAIDIH